MQLGKYEILEELGQGGFGIVYKAKDLTLEREVALKVLHPQLTVDSKFIDNFKREARNLAKIHHPHVVTIHEIGETEGRLYIAMHYLPGGSLAERLKATGAIGVEESLAITQQVVEGLDAGHKRGIIHRDVKPGNILFDEDGRAVIADFGVARAVQLSSMGTASETGGTVGTPYYRAPELWRGKPAPSAATDVYSLACVVYEMLTGQVLFSGDTPDELITRHLLEDAGNMMDAAQVKLPTGIQAVLTRALAKDPTQRFESMPTFLEGLQAGALKGHKGRQPTSKDKSPATKSDAKPTAAQTPSSRTPAATDSRKRPGWVWWGVGGAVFVVGLLAVMGIAWLLKNIIGPPSTPVPTSAATETEVLVVAPSLTLTEREISASTNTSVPANTTVPTSTQTQAPAKGTTQKRDADGMEMVYIPAGSFSMGSTDAELDWVLAQSWCSNCERSWFEDEQPAHTVSLDAFWMDKYEVSNGQYKKCVDAGECDPPAQSSSYTRSAYYGTTQYADYPVIYVSWYAAQAYCAWAGGSLPTEAQWEYAARGTDGRTYPWWNESPSCDLANAYNSATGSYCVGDTTPVNSYPAGASPFGVFNMAGNVWEWVADRYGDYSSGSQTNPTGPTSGNTRVLRGGSWSSNWYYIRAAYRSGSNPDYTDFVIGFRCVSFPGN